MSIKTKIERLSERIKPMSPEEERLQRLRAMSPEKRRHRIQELLAKRDALEAEYKLLGEDFLDDSPDGRRLREYLEK